MKMCSRCGAKHDGKFDTCDDCRAYNNANKFIFRMAEDWDIAPEIVRDGFKKALDAKGKMAK